MMFRMMLSAVVVISCGACGILRSLVYSERLRLISELITMIEHLNIEMMYRMESLPDLFIRLSDETRAGRFLDRLVSLYRDDAAKSTLCECWEKAADELYSGTSLTYGDIKVIKEAGRDIGSCDAAGQKRMSELSLISLRELKEEAETEMRIKSRMYISLGFTAGIFMTVMLI